MVSLFITVGRFLRSLWLGLKEPEFRALFLFVVILLLSGSLFYWQTEKWSFLDSLYFCVTTLTTIGSHMEPVTASGKIFTIVYILFGLGTVAAFIAAIAQYSKEQHPRLERFRKKKETQ